MAFSILRQPATYAPGYNELTFKVSSTNTAEPQMKYIFKTYVGDDLVSTNKMFPRPDGYCYFDAQPIVKNYLGSEMLPQSIIQASNGEKGQSINFYVEFYEEYEIAGTITESPLRATSNTINIFEMVAPYNVDINTYMDRYDVSHITVVTPFADRISRLCGPQKYAVDSWSLGYSKPIQTKDTYEINPNEYRVVTLIGRNRQFTTRTGRMYIRVYTKAGDVKLFYVSLNNSPEANPINNMINVQTDIPYINANLVVVSVPGGYNSYIDPDEDFAYAIEFRTGSGNISLTHQPIIYRIKDVDCYQYDHITLMYKSQNGGWWYINTDMKHFETNIIERFVYESKRQWDDSSTFRTSRVYGQNGSESLTLTTDWLYSQYDVAEVQDLLSSPNVYAIFKNDSTGIYDNIVPVVINTSSFAVKQLSQDKMTQYTIEVTKAYNKKFVI